MLKEFQEFIAKGNVIDLAVGIIIGAAFTGIVNSVVNDLIMPIFGAIGGVDFSNYFLPLSSNVTAVSLEEARKQGAVFAYGNFMTVLINFIILAWIVFLIVRRHQRACAGGWRRRRQRRPRRLSPRRPMSLC